MMFFPDYILVFFWNHLIIFWFFIIVSIAWYCNFCLHPSWYHSGHWLILFWSLFAVLLVTACYHRDRMWLNSNNIKGITIQYQICKGFDLSAMLYKEVINVMISTLSLLRALRLLRPENLVIIVYKWLTLQLSSLNRVPVCHKSIKYYGRYMGQRGSL